jgi:SAM-dependent methyltransferase
MDPARQRRIKSVVRENFDVSPAAYAAFEERFGLFARLARTLASLAGAGPGSRVLDMGCGTGDSTAVLARRAGPDGLVVGLDISAAMLRAGVARRLPDGSAPVLWVQGDAEAPACLSAGRFDLVLYNASAFLLPDAAAGIARARGLLAPGGRLGASMLRGLVDADTGERVIESPGAIADPDVLRGAFGSPAGPAASTREIVEAPGGQARSFYCIPAQSGSIFPGLPLEERIRRTHALFHRLEASGIRLGLDWEFIVSAPRGGEPG